MWEGNKAQAAALGSVMIGGAKHILGCSSRTCNEAVRGDMGLDSLQGCRDKAKLKWWYNNNNNNSNGSHSIRAIDHAPR